MRIKWLGHSCFLITASSGEMLLTDPYDPDAYPGKLLYAPLDESPDVVTLSHGHPDHYNVGALKGEPHVAVGLSEQESAGFRILGVSSFHDHEQGQLRGGNIIYRITVDGITICHLGDIGHVLPPEKVEQLGPVDVLLIPVGGTYTVDAAAATEIWHQLDPAITIPMHFGNEKCLFPIDSVELFLEGKPAVERPGISELELSKETLPAGPKIVVLKPAN